MAVRLCRCRRGVVGRENEQVVRGSDGDCVFPRVIASMQDLSVEIHVIGIDVVHAHTPGTRFVQCGQFTGLERSFVSLKNNIRVPLPIDEVEVIAVTAGEDGRARRSPNTLKLVKNTVIFVKITQFRTQIVVNGNRGKRT